MNVVLIGYRGTGKSTVARLLADRLGFRVVSLDKEIEKNAGKSIPQIVEEQGWSGFRDLEEEIVKRFAEQDGQILDCGGGVVEREANFERLRSAGPVFWLKASVATIVARIAGDTQRPSLTGTKSFTDEVAEVLERRKPLYAALADFEIETDERTPEQVVDEICKLLVDKTESA